MYIVELTTREGRVAERFATYAEARRRVEQYPTETLLGLPLIFRELADGSERLVREDGKPLQFHRRYAEEEASMADAPLPLVEDTTGLVGPDGKLQFVEPTPPGENWGDLPLA